MLGAEYCSRDISAEVLSCERSRFDAVNKCCSEDLAVAMEDGRRGGDEEDCQGFHFRSGKEGGGSGVWQKLYRVCLVSNKVR